MSSILKALKKLESEQNDQEKVQGLLRTVHLKKGRTSPVHGYWRTPKFFGLVIIVLLLAVIGAVAWKYDEKKPSENRYGVN